jgi:uncharacterized membrane protein
MSANADLNDRTIFLILAYFWILCLVPLFTRREDAEVQWHAKNGLALFLVETACILALALVGLPVLLLFRGHGFLFLTVLFFLFWALVLALHIGCVLKALQGGRFRIPGLTDWAERI